jgi:hypothetical protein
MVVFPDGFQSMGQVLRMDSDWDLAAILINKPPVAPVRIAREPPRIGETLTIAGYGSGSYRAVAGACTQYLAPSVQHPFELVELAASARQGDSGGPILNIRGELAGVLFGEGGGRTTGSYCGRVHSFLTLAVQQLKNPNAAQLAGVAESGSGSAQAGEYFVASTRDGNGRAFSSSSATAKKDGWQARPSATNDNEWRDEPFQPAEVAGVSQNLPSTSPVSFYGQSPHDSQVLVASSAEAPIASISPPNTQGGSVYVRGDNVRGGDVGGVDAISATRAAANAKAQRSGPEPSAYESFDGGWSGVDESARIDWQFFAGDTLLRQLKTVLACLGGVAVFFHGTRLLARRSAAEKKSSVKRSRAARA